MVRQWNERGATLILVIGVVATLAILAAAITALTVNVQHNTATARTQSKAFNVAEAGLDAGQSALWVNWPKPVGNETPSPLPSVNPTTFAQEFVSSEFPPPKTGAFIDVKFYDDDGNMANPGMRTGYNYDQNKNDYMWVVSRGATGSRAAKVQAMVKKVTLDLRIREGVALYTDSTLSTKGAGNQPVVGLDPPAVAASAYARGGWIANTDQTDLEGGIALNPDQALPLEQRTKLTDIFPDAILTSVIETANGAQKVYHSQGDIPVEAWSTQPRIIVIEQGGVDTKDIPDTDPFGVWGDGQPGNGDPGILIVLSGDMKSIGQQKAIWGIVYLMDGILLEGNAMIHGMLIAKGSADLRGTRAVNYNSNVVNNLNRPFALTVKVVPNTWRELNPHSTP